MFSEKLEDAFIIYCKGSPECTRFVCVPLSELRQFIREHGSLRDVAESFICGECKTKIDLALNLAEHSLKEKPCAPETP